MKKILSAYRLRPEGLKELEGKYEIVLPKDKSHFTKEEVMQLIPILKCLFLLSIFIPIKKL